MVAVNKAQTPLLCAVDIHILHDILQGLRFQRNDLHRYRTGACDLPTPQTHRTDSWGQRDRPRSAPFRHAPFTHTTLTDFPSS